MKSPYDIVVQRGANAPAITWIALSQFNPDLIFDLTGSIVRLTVALRDDTVLFRKEGNNDTEDLFYRVATGIVTWVPTLVESRLIPVDPPGKYELEYRFVTKQRVIALGSATGIGGINDD